MTRKTEPIAWPLAYRILKDKWDATPGEVAIWIGNSDLRAYWYRGNPNGPLARISFLADARGDDYRLILATLFFSKAEIDGFTPQTRYLTFEQLSERWRRFFECGRLLTDFIIAATGAGTDNLSIDLTPLDPLDRRDCPIEECLFNEAQVKWCTEEYFGSEPRLGANGRLETEASFEICSERYEREVGGPDQHRAHMLNRARELTVPAALEVLNRDLGGDYPDNLELLATLYVEHELQVLNQGIAPIQNTVISALYAAMTLGFVPKTDPSTGEAAEVPSIEQMLENGNPLARPLHVCKIRRESMLDALLSHGGVAGLASWPGLETIESRQKSEEELVTEVRQGNEGESGFENSFQLLEGLDWHEIAFRFRTDTGVLGPVQKQVIRFVS